MMEKKTIIVVLLSRLVVDVARLVIVVVVDYFGRTSFKTRSGRMTSELPTDLKEYPKLDIGENVGLGEFPGILFQNQAIQLPRNLKPSAKYCLGIDLGSPNLHLHIRFSQIGALLNNMMEVLSYNVVHQMPEHSLELERLTKKMTLELEDHLGKIISVLETNRSNIHLDFKEKEKEVFSKYEILFRNQQRIVNQLLEIKEGLGKQSLETKVNFLEEKLEELSLEMSVIKTEAIKTKTEVLEEIKEISEYLKRTLGE